jgi:hypothetical protein
MGSSLNRFGSFVQILQMIANGLPQGVDGSDGLCAQMRLELGEGHFDRAEVGL